VTTVSSGRSPGRKAISTYFRAAFDVEDPALFAYLRLHILRDDGVVVYLNGQEVLRDNMPQGAIGKDTRAASIVSNDDENTFFPFEASASALRQGRNVIAVELHQQAPDSSDLAFDLEVEGVGGLGVVSRTASELESVEERLDIPGELRGLLWASRAERFRRSGDPERASEALERAKRLDAGNPGLAHERAHLLRARGDEKAAFAAYREAVEGAIALKTLGRTGRVAFLPDALELPVEPLMKLTGVGLAGAARRLSRLGSAIREADARWLLEWSRELDPEGHAARLERAEALIANGWIDEALAAADAALASTRRGEPVPRRVREEKEWLVLREKCLVGLGKMPEAEEVLVAILEAPPRRPGLSPRLIDLSKHYTASLYDGRGWHSNENLRLLPETFRPRDGIDFDIRGLIQLQSGRYPPGTLEISGKDMNELYGKSFPEAVKGIQVGLRTKALHFLTSGSWCNGAAGTEVSRILIHYEDGATAECPIRFREDVIDWSWGSDQRLPLDRIAWVGGRPIKRLMRKTWTNPHPDKPIREIDFVSAMTTAAPFLVAVTAE
jgi:tetratricopeptide (TPR) repeat protein